MSNVWISKASWERLWNAMHNVQIRFNRLLSHPSGGITGDGPTAQFRIDLPERYQDPPQQWCCELSELGNDSWQVQFYSSSDPSKAGTVHYRGSVYDISASDCSFEVNANDLSRIIRVILVKQVDVSDVNGVRFVPRLTHMDVPTGGIRSGQYVCIAELLPNSQRTKLFFNTFHDQPIEWYDPFYRNNQLHLDIAFGPTPASTDGFREFLDGAVQYLVFDEHFCLMVNGFSVRQISDATEPSFSMIAIDQYYVTGKLYIYVYWACDISNSSSNSLFFSSPVNPRFEFLPDELTSSNLSYYRYRQVHIPVMTLICEQYPLQCDAAQSGIYRVCGNVYPTNIPLYWINTYGMDFYPEIQDGWIMIDLKEKKVVINGIRCYGNDSYIGLIPRQTIAYQNTLPFSGSLTVCCVFDQENNLWGTPYLMNGNQALTSDNSGVTGRVCSVEIAQVEGNDPKYTHIRQNYGGPVRLISYEYQISRIKADLASAKLHVQDEIESLLSSIRSLREEIYHYHH